MGAEDRERFTAVRSSLNDLFGWLASSYNGDSVLKAYASRVNPNGRSPSDLWACVFPAVVGHQSYALQVALIIRRDGAELCFCLGSGGAQVNDPAKRQKLDAAFADLRAKLATAPDELVVRLADGLGPDFEMRKQWRGAPGISEFDGLASWLTHAAGPHGAGASVSRFFTREELDGLSFGVAETTHSLLAAVQPLLDFIYATAPPPMDPIPAALAKFAETVDPDLIAKYRLGWLLGKAAFDATFGSAALLDQLTPDRFFAFLNQIDSHTNAESGLFRLGPGLPAPKNPDTESWKALEEDLPLLKQALATVLNGDGSLAERIDTLLAAQPHVRRYVTEDLALPSMLMCFADEANHSGVNRMSLKRIKLHALGKLQPAGSTGEAFVAWDAALRHLPAEYGMDWDWAMTYAFYWSDVFEEFFGSIAAADVSTPADLAPPDDDALVSLASSLFLSDDHFLVELREMLFEKGQLVLYGPPGTGKTFLATKFVEVLAPDAAQRDIVQFHPSYSYEDFVRGYRPVTNQGALTYEPQDGPLVTLAEKARADPANLYTLVIDEINRGNLPRIFGELLYLLEYRNQAVQLMYPAADGSRGFSLPRNLLIVATMNTADRSIGVIDAALRRRFHFVELAPNVAPIDGLLRRWLQATNPAMLSVADWVDRLNHKLTIDFPGRQLQVGHSYFMPTTPIVGTDAPVALTAARVERIWRTDVEPFLQDQLFGQPQTIPSYSLSAIRKAAEAAQKIETPQVSDDDGPSDTPDT